MNSLDQNRPDRNFTDHFSDEDLVLFALQFLSVEQTAAVIEHLQTCESCRMALGEIQGDLALVALTSEPQELPAQAREQFLRRVAKEKKLIPIDRRQPEAVQGPRDSQLVTSPSDNREKEIRRGRGQPAVALAWLGWAVAAVLGVFAFLQFQQRQHLAGKLAVESANIAQAQNQAANAQDQAVSAQNQAADAHNQAASAQHQVAEARNQAANAQNQVAEARNQAANAQDQAASAQSQAANAQDQGARAQQALQTLTAAGAMQVSLHLPSVKAPPPEAHAAYIASKGALVLVASHLKPLAAGKTYELWLLPAAAHGAPIPAGTFRPDVQGYASVVLPSLPTGVAAKGFGVTVEPEGGSPAPTSPIILAGT